MEKYSIREGCIELDDGKALICNIIASSERDFLFVLQYTRDINSYKWKAKTKILKHLN